MKKIGVISDTHLMELNDHIKKIAYTHFSDVDLIIHAGDIVKLGVLDIFHEMGKKFIAVAGNMDYPGVLDTFPAKQTVKIEDVSMGVIHGWGSPDGIRNRIRSEFTDVDVIIYGHTHKGFNRKEDGIFYFNPGSPTDTRFTKNNSIGIIRIKGNKIQGELIEV